MRRVSRGQQTRKRYGEREIVTPFGHDRLEQIDRVATILPGEVRCKSEHDRAAFARVADSFERVSKPRFGNVEASVQRFETGFDRKRNRKLRVFGIAERSERTIDQIGLAAVDQLEAALAEQSRERHRILQVGVEFDRIRPPADLAADAGRGAAAAAVRAFRIGAQPALEEVAEKLMVPVAPRTLAE